MDRNVSSKFTLNTGTDLAFALVVFISFFATFSNASVTEPFLITVIILLGIAYITNGIYGFAHTSKTGTTFAKLVYFSLQLIIGGLIVFYGKGAGFNALILLPIVAHSAMLLDQDWMLAANVAIIFTFIISVYLYSSSLSVVWAAAPIFFVGQVFILIFTQMAVTEQRARVKLETLATQLSEANKHLSEYADRVRELTITQERNRMAREIHDGLGHYLTTISMQIQAAYAVFSNDKDKAKSLLTTAQNLTSIALEDVRSSVFALRQDPNELSPLFERIEEMVKATSTPGRKMNAELVGTPRVVSPQIDLTLFRAAQETINNANKHANASNVKLILDYSDNKGITLVACDDGIGTDKILQGYGLIGIQERVRLLNGIMTINSSAGKGFNIKISIPSKNEH
ncbi:MAG: two-component sensor histidine kinase [Chloroflexi bacterium]|nr:MAG: two-component sensor histidine kinase [Chloroflexota bacterium]